MSESRLLRSRSRKGSFKESSVNNQPVINFVVRKHDTKSVKETGVIMNTSPSKRSIRDENSGSCENNISPCKRPRTLSERLEIRLPLSPHKDTWNSSELLTPCATKTLVSSFADIHGPHGPPFRPSSNKKEQILSCSDSAAQVGESSPSSSTRRNLASDFSKNNSKGMGYQSTKQVLHTSLPSDQLIGRLAESELLTSYLCDHLLSETSASLYVSGAPGTGKTAVVLKVIEQLKSDSAFKCKTLYLNCMIMKNAHDIYKTILSSLAEKEFHSSVKQSLSHIEAHLTQSSTMNILILDEMDSLESKNQEVLYTIFEWPSLPNSKLILIGIANSLDLTDRILPRLNARSWCRPKLLHFAPYTRDEIAAIINHRLSQVPDGESALDPAAVQLCARKLSAVTGDARAALDVCRRAVEAVEAECHRQLRMETVTSTKDHSVFRKVGLKDVLKVIGQAVGGWSRAGTQSERALTLPLQHTVAICSLLLMLDNKANKITSNEVTLGKFHETFVRVCKQHGIAGVEQSEFLTVCELVETRGIFGVKKARDTRATKVWLKMDAQELEQILQDRTLMSTILKQGLP